MAATKQFCTFLLGELYLGVEVHRVQEVIRYQDMTRVPMASPVVQGLINLRGQIVTAIDLRRRFDLPLRAEGECPMNVIVRLEDGIVSLLVDEIGDVLEVTEAACEGPPATLRGPARELIHSVYKLDHRLLLVLDVEQALNIDASGMQLAGDPR